MNDSTAQRDREVALRYLHNTDNRGVFERPDDIAGRTSGDPVDFLLHGDYARRAERELEPIARAWETDLVAPPTRILDAGCATGVTTLALAKRYPDAEVVGVDVEEEALALAAVLGRGESRCAFHLRGLEDMHDEAGFDLIQCRAVLEHVFDPVVATERLMRLLRPGGIAYVETPNYFYPWEPHLQMPIVPKSPKPLLRLQCRLTGRDPHFVDHLNLTCDPRTVTGWAKRAQPDVRVRDLSAEKAEAIFGGAGVEPVVSSRARLTRLVRRAPALARAGAWAFRELPIAPSVILLFQRPAADGRPVHV